MIMFRKTLLTFLTAFFILPLLTSAQEYSGLSFNKFRDWDDFRFNKFDDSRPFIEVNYGLGEPKHKNFNGNFGNVGLSELKLGYINKDETWEDYILETSESYFFGSRLSPNLSSENLEFSELDTDLWRFGAGFRDGFGYGTNSFAVIPYHQWAFSWSRLDVDEIDDGKIVPPILPGIITEVNQDYEILKRYDEAFRFGMLTEGGARIEFVDFISLNFGYETAVIFPRHLFWKHAGSFILEHAGLGLIGEFVDEIFESTPAAAPVVNFILKNGYSFAFYKLKQENMNWPFETETPLTYETFKFGVTFTF